MLIVETVIDQFNTGFDIMIDTETCEMQIDMIVSDGTVLPGKVEKFPNLISLSACFCADVGLRTAIDILTRNNVPTNSPLWELNHSNPHRN